MCVKLVHLEACESLSEAVLRMFVSLSARVGVHNRAIEPFQLTSHSPSDTCNTPANWQAVVV